MIAGLLTSLLVLGAALLQGAIPGLALLGQARLPLLLGVVLYVALNRHWGTMVAVCLGAGLLQDTLSMIPLGYTTLLFCICGFVAYRSRPLVVCDSVLTAACFGAPCALFVTALLWVLLLKERLVAIPLGQGLVRLGGETLLGFVVVPLIFLLAARLFQAIGEELSPEEADGRD